ncbi:hypothetical protein B0T24DRAFT_50281 [Lasiosphaeria ovina]|uniref:polynucleotide adenylyltransferase n=1 Tax=Lasiosphaeria ovina TaxID=92902 RepID=A0AAE0NKY6_9PEZI|nr:hypothetical protein B0T24DRAFT_50281 [Lasiosphaeria ovina]
MEDLPATAEPSHLYQTNPWSHAASASTSPRVQSPTSPETSPGYFPAHLDFLPILYPHQSSLYQDKLLQYNKLISASRGGGGGGGGLQTQAPPPVLTSHPQPTTRARASSKVSNKDNHAKQGVQSCHGNRTAKTTEIAERAHITSGKEQPTKMSGKRQQSEQPTSNGLLARPPPAPSHASHFPAIHSSSVPSTPHQHARKYSFESREQSPGATQNHSPRSAYSETNGNVPSLRPLPPRLGSCRFETAIPYSRRRMPYNLGTDKLEKVDLSLIRSTLAEDDEKRLETDLRELYHRLLPTNEVEINRRNLVAKLERLFNQEWPGHDIRVHLFGSSGNLLCSDDSDVDICITTPWRELENVCLIADLLDRHGMEKVVCVSSAKVPIVKIWDPELNLACDMNVNNTLALENTRMVRTYVETDERVRPLAMIIKYWTRKRIVNDAAFGGTLSSYTWICMIIAFLQLRDPPVLPALHQKHQLKLPRPDGTRSEFADDLEKLRGFGSKNKETLANLLFHFFRFYAHEFDYGNHALSIRLGKTITKTEKKWHLHSNNVLCIEEPFNTVRNLGNTADDTSFRGLHLELRRAFSLISEGKLAECCEEYVFPKEEERVYHKPAAQAPRPILVRSSSQQNGGRGGRGGYRANRQFNRNGNSSRRASSSVAAYDTNGTFPPQGMPTTMGGQEILWYQAPHPPIGVPQELLASSLNALAAHETNLRFQLYTQAQQINQQQVLAHAQRMQGGSTQATDRSRTNSFDNPPLTAPIRPELIYGFGFPIQHPAYFHPGFTTYPSSPATATAAANGLSDFRRSLHRTAATTDAGAGAGSGALRSQSQPASRTSMVGSQAIPGNPAPSRAQNGQSASQQRHVNGVPIPSFMADEAADVDFDDAPAKAVTDSPPEDDGPRYIGYYVNEASSPPQKSGIFPSPPIPSFGDLGQGVSGRRRLSQDQLPQSILDRRMKRTSRSPSPLGHARAFSVGTSSAPLTSAPFQQINSKLMASRGPVVVNGTAPNSGSASSSSRQTPSSERTASDDGNFDNPLHISQGLGISGSWVDQRGVHPAGSVEPSPPSFPDRPVIANGSSGSRTPTTAHVTPDASINQRLMMGTALHSGVPYQVVGGESNGIVGFSPPSGGRSRVISRQQQSGIAPLDLATGEFTVAPELQHLSPVYEHRTPSPTAVRRFDAPPIVSPSLGRQAREPKVEASKATQKPVSSKTPPTGPSAKNDGASRSPVVDPRVNGVAKENGHTRGVKSQSEAFGPWQKPKPRKKGTADPKNTVNGFTQGEQLPKNDSDRKGG